MTNPFYVHGDGVPVQGSRAVSANMRSEFDLIQTGFDIAQNYYVDTGVANAMVISPSTGIASLTDGLRFWIKAAASTTGATIVNMGATLGTAIPLKRMDGSAISTDILANDLFLAVYKTSTSALHLVGTTKNYVDQLAFGTALPNQTGNSGKIVTTDGTSASWTAVKTVGGVSILGSGDIITGISTVGATVTDNYTILTATPTIWPCATTAIGKSLTAPAANGAGMTKGLFAVIDNKAGGYPVGYRDSTGSLIIAVAPGGVANIYLEDTSTAAGTWRATGTNLEPGLITLDNTFSSTYASTLFKPFVALDTDKSIHFLALSSGFAAVAVDNATKAVGTPVTVDSTASSVPKAAFKITSTTAIVFYGSTTSTLNAVVLSLSGATSLAVGTAQNSGANTGIAVEDFSAAPKIAQLSSTLYLVSWATATGAGNTSVMAVSVSGTTITFGSKADIITTNNCIDSTLTFGLTATTALVVYNSGAAAPFTVSGVVISVSGTTCTVGTPAATGTVQLATATSSCLLSSTKALVACDTGQTEMAIYALTISGTTVTAGSKLTVEALAGTSALQYTQDSATRYNPHIWAIGANTAGLWYFGSNVSRAVVLSESGGTVTKGTIVYRNITAASSSSAEGGLILPQGAAEFTSIKQGGTSSAWKFRVCANKVSGTTITSGDAYYLLDVPPDSTATSSVGCARMTTGDYVLYAALTSDKGWATVPVFRSNGDFINFRGYIRTPNLSGVTGAPPYAVSSNRLVLLGSTIYDSTTVGASTYQVRLINVEIAQ